MEKMLTYNIVVDYDNENERMIRNSFVDAPAVEIEKFAFSKEKMIFNQDKTNQCFMSVSILADTPIPRVAKDGTPYNVVFTKDVIRVIANKLSMEGKLNEVSWQHSDQIIEGVYLVEQFISEKDRVYSPKFNIPEGSLVQTYFVKDKKMYDKLANDPKFQGFSIEIECGIQEAINDFKKMTIEDKVKEILFNDTLTDDYKYETIKKLIS